MTRLLAIVSDRTPELRHACLVTLVAAATYALAELFNVRLVLWSVLTAVIVMQLGAHRTLKATMDYFAGTLAGAVFAGAVATLVPHSHEPGVLAVLAVVIGPLAFLAAVKPAFAAAPFTAALVVLAPALIHASPLASAWNRVVEVALGGSVAVAASLLALWPASRSRPQAAGSGPDASRPD